MKKWGCWILAVLAVSVIGGRQSAGMDVARLRPVEVVAITEMDGKIQLRTDTGDWGTGEDLHSAIRNLEDTAPAQIFLDTAEYLLVDKACVSLLEDLKGYLRPSCNVCLLKGEPDLETVAAFLQMHKPAVTLRDYKAKMTEYQILKVTEGRMELVS